MLTALDQVANQNHLQVLKAAVPYLPAARQKNISVLIKMLELQNILRYYSGKQFRVTACSTQNGETPDILDVLSDIRNYCEGTEQAMIDQLIQMMGMMELYSTFAQTGDMSSEEML